MKGVFVAVAVASAMLLAAAAFQAPGTEAKDAPWMKKLAPSLVSDIASKPGGEMVKVIIKYKPGQDSPGQPRGLLGLLSADGKSMLKSAVVSSGGKVVHDMAAVSAVSAYVPAGSLASLASDASVEAVYPVKTYFIDRLQSATLSLADVAAAGYAVNGTGINISIIDTGVFNHSEFQNPARIVLQKCYCSGCCPPNNADSGSNATDDHGHGTHVAGIAAGQGNSSYGYGVAANASIFAVKVCNSAGSCASDDIMSGIVWSVANGANIISMSLGGAVYGDCYNATNGDGLLGDMVDNYTAQGVLFVIAAGNCGPTGNPLICPTKGSQTISSPGCAKSALTVGAADDDDGLASYSSLGATLDNRTKPDVVAVGSSVVSTHMNGGYISRSGTSMATPLVSGEAALIIQRYRNVFGYMPDPSLVKAIIMTAVNTTGMQADGYLQRNNYYGAGRVDVNQSLRIVGFSANGSISGGQLYARSVTIPNGTFIVTLYWPENSSARNDLSLVVGNSTVNFSQATSANDTVEQAILSNALAGRWNIYVNGTNVTGSQRYFLVWSQSLSMPYWYGNRTVTAAAYNGTNASYFNITWSSDAALASAWLEANWSGSAANYSMTHYGSGNYSYSAILPDGFFYWRGWANDSAGNVNSTDSWTFTVLNTGPSLSGASFSPQWALTGDNITAYANASDYSLDSVWLNISNTTGFATALMQNISASFNVTYNTSGLAVGAYSVGVYANDTRGNATNLTIGILSVTVRRNITVAFLGRSASSANVSVIVFYNGTATARNYTDNTTGLSTILPEGVWDIRLSSTFNATLFSVNTSSDAVGNITIDDVPNANISIPGFVPVQAAAMESGINFSNATITLSNSSINSSLNMTVLACHSWNMSNRSCSSSWSNVTANSSISTGLALINTANLSAFVVARNSTCGDGIADVSETSSTCCQDAGCSSGQSCGSDGACYTPAPPGGSSTGSSSSSSYVPPKKKSLSVSSDSSVRLLNGVEGGFAVAITNNGEAGLSGIRLSHSSGCDGLSVGYYNGSIDLAVNESRSFRVSLTAGRAGSCSITMAAAASGASGSASAALSVLECEPGSSACDGETLLVCSGDGLSQERRECAYGCESGRCEEKAANITANIAAPGPAEGIWLTITASMIAVMIAAGIFIKRWPQ